MNEWYITTHRILWDHGGSHDNNKVNEMVMNVSEMTLSSQPPYLQSLAAKSTLNSQLKSNVFINLKVSKAYPRNGVLAWVHTSIAYSWKTIT